MNMDSEWEMLLANVEKKLLTLSLTELSAVSEDLGLQPSEEIKSSCRLLRRLILGNLESEDVTGLEDTGLSVLLATNDFIDSLKKKKKTYDASRDNVSTPEGETNEQPEAVVQRPLSMEDGTTPQPALSPQRPSSLTGSERDSTQTRGQVNLHPMYRKDFRIIG